MKETIVKLNKTKSWLFDKINKVDKPLARLKEKSVRNTDTWRLNNIFLNNQQVTKEIKMEIKKFLETNDNEKNDNSKPMGCSKSSSKKEVYRNIILPQETRKTSNRQPNSTPKTTGKRRTKKPPKSNHKDPSRNK